MKITKSYIYMFIGISVVIFGGVIESMLTTALGIVIMFLVSIVGAEDEYKKDTAKRN